MGLHPQIGHTQIASPRITHIRVGRDTVSFYAREGEYGGSERRVVRYARRSGAWMEGDERQRPVRLYVPESRRDSVHLTSGWRLVGRESVPGQQWLRNYSIVDVRAGRSYPLRPTLSVAQRWRATSARDSVGHGEYVLWWDDPPTPCERVYHWTADPRGVWFACTSGGDGLGVLMRFDRSSRRIETLTGAEVASIAIVGLAETRRALWIAGNADSAASLADAGLFRLDLGTRTWSRIPADSDARPPGVPTAVAASGDSLWIATSDGVALYDERGNRWDGRQFHARMVVDTTDADADRPFIAIDHRFSLVGRRPSIDEARTRLSIEVAEWIVRNGPPSDPVDTGASSLNSVLSAIRAVAPAHWDSALASPSHVVAHALATPALIAAAAGWLFADSSEIDAEMVRAIGILRDRRYLPTLRDAWHPAGPSTDGSSVAASFELATALSQFRDTAALRWLREIATKNPDWNQIEPAVDALVAVGDTAVAPALAERLSEPGADEGDGPALLLGAFSRVATPGQWRAAIPALAASGRLRLALLDRFYARRSVDSIVRSEPVSRAAAIAIARHELTTQGETGKVSDGKVDRWAAADVAVLMGDSGAVPYLIPLLTQSAQDYRAATTTLIRLTGVDSAPPWAAPTPSQRATARRFWSDWWKAHGPVPVPETALGKAALRSWRVRALGL